MYATLSDILEQVAEAELIALTDDEQLGAVDQTVVDRAIANAGALIDGHCRDRYVVPFAPVPDLVRMFAVDLAVFNLYGRRTHIETPAVILERQKQALAYLKRVQDGAATLGAAVKLGSHTASNGATYTGADRLFTRPKMRW
jgi:phage gp36-like protein